MECQELDSQTAVVNGLKCPGRHPVVFGRSHLGTIQGCAQMLTVFASALGPLLLAESLRHSGSYNLIFQVLAVTVVVLGIACWFVAVPYREVRSQSAHLCDPISEPSA